MNNLNQQLYSISSQDIETKKTWYSPTAEAYNQTRPTYPQELINRVVTLAQLPAHGRILEIGCGPGNATITFAKMGFSLVCLEPNQDFCLLARQNCQKYSTVEILNCSFEEWQLEAEQFDAVLAATSIHWVSPDVAYSKAADALKEKGSLILLWNVIPEPHPDRYQAAIEIYKTYAPSLVPYEDQNTQKSKLKGFEEIILNSGRFTNLVSDVMECERTYSFDDYLQLLSTLSPYLKLEPQQRDNLFKNLSEKRQEQAVNEISLSYLSAFHLAQKS